MTKVIHFDPIGVFGAAAEQLQGAASRLGLETIENSGFPSADKDTVLVVSSRSDYLNRAKEAGFTTASFGEHCGQNTQAGIEELDRLLVLAQGGPKAVTQGTPAPRGA